MSDWTEVKRINSEDGLRYLVILSAKDGMFSFVEHAKHTEVEEHQTYTYFAPSYQSGLYGSVSDAERDANFS